MKEDNRYYVVFMGTGATDPETGEPTSNIAGIITSTPFASKEVFETWVKDYHGDIVLKAGASQAEAISMAQQTSTDARLQVAIYKSTKDGVINESLLRRHLANVEVALADTEESLAQN